MNRITRALQSLAAIILMLLPAAVSAQLNTPIQFFRPYDASGINTFEPTRQDTVPYAGLGLRIGASFTQQFQSLQHENTAAAVMVGGVNQNQLISLGPGFNLATANLNLDAQLAEGVRVNLITYLSSRHHPETWVKAGFLQIDALPFLNSAIADRIMQNVRLRVGHFEINYGDTHFRRTDNGNAMYNPLVGNYIMDSFTTEIGGEVYVFSGPVFAMAAMTDGEIRGETARPEDRSPSYYGKLGLDKQVNPMARVRLTGSVYHTGSSISNTLYGGDRAGSRYYYAMEKVGSTISAAFTSGRINPGFSDKVTAWQINPFIQLGGLELFGVIEQAKGRGPNERINNAFVERTWNQYAAEALFRFLPGSPLYVVGRYNVVKGPLAVSGGVMGPEVSVDRWQLGGGWFVTRQILAKIEYVNQEYTDFPSTDIRNGGRFHGITVEGVISF